MGVPLMTKEALGFASIIMISLVIISVGTMLASSRKIQSGWYPLSLSGEQGNAISLLFSGGFSLITVRVVPGRWSISRISGFAIMVE